MYGTPPIRALFFEFPDEPELFEVDRQFLIGHDILVTPVLAPNVSTVDGESALDLWHTPRAHAPFRHIPRTRPRGMARLV